MADFCALGDWVLPLVAIVGGIVMSTMVGYGLWNFGVSPVRIENQQLGQLNQELTQDLAVTKRWERFYLNAYTREKEVHCKMKAQYSIIRKRLEALERDRPKPEGSSSALQERSKPEEHFDHTSDSGSLGTFEGPSCPLENYLVDPAYVEAIFAFFSWVIWATIFLLLSYRFRKFLWLCNVHLAFLWLSSLSKGIKQTFHRLSEKTTKRNKIKPHILEGIKE